MMLKRVGSQLKTISSMTLLTATALFLVSPAVNASKVASSVFTASQPLPQPLVHIETLTSSEANLGRDSVLENLAATQGNQPAPTKVGLGRSCADPWWELSGIQWLTCKLM